MTENQEQVPHRPLGKTGVQVSALGVGGYHLGSIKDQNESTELVARALDAGINFFDNCWEYHDGISEERMGTALKGKRDQAFLMTKVCTHGRTKDITLIGYGASDLDDYARAAASEQNRTIRPDA